MKNHMKIVLIAIFGIVLNLKAAGQNQCLQSCLANAGSNKLICFGMTCVTIGVSNCGNATCSTGKTYSWAPGGYTTCQVQVCPTITTTYTLYVTFDCSVCCCDGCGGTTCGSGTANPCNGSQVRQDDMIVTVDMGVECFNPESIEKIENNNIKLFADPEQGKCQFKINNVSEDMTIQIYNENGQLILQDSEAISNQGILEYYLGDMKEQVFYV
ncbi:MAG: hypothetical protein AB1458_14045, partial [Bacteroidota bacterium]